MGKSAEQLQLGEIEAQVLLHWRACPPQAEHGGLVKGRQRGVSRLFHGDLLSVSPSYSCTKDLGAESRTRTDSSWWGKVEREAWGTFSGFGGVEMALSLHRRACSLAMLRKG